MKIFKSKLEKYIQDSLDQGFNLIQIRDACLDAGYSEDQIEKAIKTTNPSKKFDQNDIILITGAIIAAIFFLVIILLSSGSNEEIGIVVSTQDYAYPGESISLDIKMFSSNPNNLDVSIEITDEFGNTITSKNQNYFVEGSMQKSIQIMIPFDAKGTLDIRANAYSDSLTSTSYTSIGIESRKESNLEYNQSLNYNETNYNETEYNESFNNEIINESFTDTYNENISFS